MRSFFKLLAVMLWSSMTICLQAQGAGNALNTDDGWKQLSLREKIGQTMVLASNIDGEKALGGGSLDAFFAKYPVSGMFLGYWKFLHLDANLRSAANRELAAEYQAASRIPLFIQQDFEQGPGESLPDYTRLPLLMALGATNSQALASDYGKTMAMDSRSLGFNWVLNPVVDVSLNFMNPVVNTRSISDDPGRAIRLLGSEIKAMHDSGVISTIKHFPGDGMDFRDQHMVTTINSLSLSKWHRTYGRVFQELINQGAPSVMIGHITLPAYQKERPNGRPLPATLSSEIITGLLKKEMGFKGVVISDALNMGGLLSYYPTQLETEIQAFKAGTHVLLWPSLEYMNALEQRILSGDIPMARLDDAVSRVWALKRRFGLLDRRNVTAAPLTEAQRKASEDAAKRVAEASITLVRNKAGLLPVNREKTPRILIVTVTPPSLAEESLKTFEPTVAALKARGFQVEMRAGLPFYQHQSDSFEAYDRVLFAFDRHTHAPIGTLQLFDTEALTAWSACVLAQPKVICISYGDPYVHDVLMPLVKSSINVYSDCPASQEALVRALTGEIPFNGSSPVDLEAVRRKLNP